MAVIAQEINDNYCLWNADNMEVLPSLKAESIGMSVYSPPFCSLYSYSNDPRDMSNCTTYEEGIDQFSYIVREVYRLTKPGRMSCVHSMDLKKGSNSQSDFPGDIVRIHEEAGFHFFCRVTIWKDPWLIARRTRVRSLMHKHLVDGAFKVRVAGPDYVLVFAKGGQDDEPVEHPYGLKTYAGGTPIPEHLVARFATYKGDQRKNQLSHWIFRQYASPVWGDIRTGRLLPDDESKENEEESHVCRLQLDVVERCLTLWSNPGDKILTPFAGVGTELYMAVLMGRKAIGMELKSSYYRQAVKNIKHALEHGEPELETFQYEMSEEDEVES